MERIYLDCNASAPLDPAVVEVMRATWSTPGNPESRHAYGRAARRSWEQATETVARILHARPDEVYFTSGGTESNNLAIFGQAPSLRPETPGHVIRSAIEHAAVVRPLERLESLGCSVASVPTLSTGIVDEDAFLAAIQNHTRLACLMLANNETGALQPVERIALRLNERGVPLHTDASQAVGRIDVDFQKLGVATLSASAHKFHGPTGIGLLLVKRGLPLESCLFGGGQQRGVRPGTPPVALAVGLATALERWHQDRQLLALRWRGFGARFESALRAALGERLVRHGLPDEALSLPQTINLGFVGIDGDALLMGLDQSGIAASIGAACASGTTEGSPTLRAMGVPERLARSSVRFSWGRFTTEAEIDLAAHRVVEVVEQLAGLRVEQTSRERVPLASDH
jgi:cysteine desulfurase